MVEDQNEAERKKTDADKVSRELARQDEAIATRREEVERELAEAEPALLAAQGAVKSIKKAHLDETESDTLQRQQAGIEGEIKLLEASIAQYKAEYAQAIREIEGIKREMDVVAGKVTRAEALLTSLASEKKRWHDTSASFQRQISSLVGDALLSAAFLTYAGLFDHRSRGRLLAEWSSALTALQVPFRSDLSPTDYLSRPAQQLEWASHGLPNDQLCVENAIILERAQHRYPLVVDPSGQATKFLLSKYAARKVQTTSFADGGFLKTLASAVRFGTPLLIQDVEESIDPLLNPVLNKELQRT
eukprot:evm.model.NODE_22336_length_4254_cov_36.411144.1